MRAYRTSLKLVHQLSQDDAKVITEKAQLKKDSETEEQQDAMTEEHQEAISDTQKQTELTEVP